MGVKRYVRNEDRLLLFSFWLFIWLLLFWLFVYYYYRLALIGLNGMSGTRVGYYFFRSAVSAEHTLLGPMGLNGMSGTRIGNYYYFHHAS